MRRRKETRPPGARFTHPLLALLTAAVAAVGAIAQCGLLIDMTTSGGDMSGSAGLPMSVAADQTAARPTVAGAPGVAPSLDVAKLN